MEFPTLGGVKSFFTGKPAETPPAPTNTTSDAPPATTTSSSAPTSDSYSTGSSAPPPNKYTGGTQNNLAPFEWGERQGKKIGEALKPIVPDSVKEGVGGAIKKLNDYKNQPHDGVPFSETSKKVWKGIGEAEQKIEQWARDHSPAYKKEAEERDKKNLPPPPPPVIELD